MPRTQIVVNELTFKLLCRPETRKSSMGKEKEEDEEIGQCGLLAIVTMAISLTSPQQQYTN